MNTARIVAIGLAALSLGACAGQTYRSPTGTTVAVRTSGEARWQDPAYFSTRVHERVARIEQRVRLDVQSGQVRREALDEFIARRNQVDGELAQIGSDGFVTPAERDYVRSIVHDMNGLSLRYSLNNTGNGGFFGNPYGGGPPSSYSGQESLDTDAWWN